MSRIEIGDQAPDFELAGTGQQNYRLADYRDRWVVLAFYPGDFTPVCTKQFCSYAEHWEDVERLDATVVGISAQPVDRHHEFKAMHRIPVPLLADTERKVAKAYRVTQPLFGTRRAVIIVDESGCIAYRHVHLLGLDFQTVDDIREALASVGSRV
jgi:peroxiredoxin Q/BCP